MLLRLFVSTLVLLSLAAPAAAEGAWQKTGNGGCEIWRQSPHDEEVVTWSGPCRYGKVEGEGTARWRYRVDGKWVEETHTGQFRDGKAEGHVVSRWPDGYSYDGGYVNGLPHGQGTGVYASGSRYVGEWRYGERNGQGVYTWDDGYSYDGSWLGNRPNGYGRMTTAKGEVYSGNWKAGCLKKGTQHAWAFTDEKACGFH